jgi:hypothetical protein
MTTLNGYVIEDMEKIDHVAILAIVAKDRYDY